MSDTSAKPPAATGNRFTNGLAIGLLAGGVAGYLFATLGGSMEGTPAAILAPSPAATPVEPAAATQMTFDVGKGTRRGSYVTFPVAVTNSSGRDVGYTKVSCVFRDMSGELVATGFTNWSAIAAGETASNELGVRSETMPGEFTQQCSISNN